jgi:hypothetical protein
MTFRAIWTALLFVLVASVLANPPVIPASKMAKAPVIDGIVDEKLEWKDATSFEGLVERLTRQPAPENARFWLGYDDKFLYFAAKLHDSAPKTIKAVETRVNTSLESDDYV